MVETERLILRKFELDDADFLLKLLNTDEWIQNIGDRNVKGITDAQNYIEERFLHSYINKGFGFYAVVLKETNMLMGMCGFAKREFLEFPDLGFALLKEYTGKGFALESAIACLNLGFNQLNFSRVLAYSLPGNFLSTRLLTKCRFTYDKNFIDGISKEELALYSLKRESFYYHFVQKTDMVL
ncbi:MAG: GNAT family N-acetyltransferase [Saprospiraceae bacterium]